MSLDRHHMEAALPAYEVGPEIGRGAFGLVFEGHHRALGRHVAIKQLPRALGADPTVQARFAGEARVVAALDHPHIVRVYDYVEKDGLRLLVMEHLPGGTLAARVASRLTPAPAPAPASACAIALGVASALRHAHERGVLHRDVKPDNVLFAADGTPKLADFGIAKLTEGDTGLTSTGAVVGTVAYMSPEQVRGDELTGASDVYSLAVVLYELLAGRLPFAPVPSVTGQLVQRVTEQPVPLAEVAPNVPEPIAAVVTRALARDVADRYADAGSFRAALLAAGTAAWGPGWVAATAVPVVDTGAPHAPELPPAAPAAPDSPTVPTVPTVLTPAMAARAPSPAPGRLPKVAAAVVAVLVVAGALAALVLRDGGGGAGEAAGAATTVAPVATVPPTTLPPATLPPTTSVPPTTGAPTTVPATTIPTATIPTATIPATTAPPVTVVVTVLVPASTVPLPPTTPTPTTVRLGDRPAAVARVGAACQGLGRSDVDCACVVERLTGLNALQINAIALSVENQGKVPARFERRFASCISGGVVGAARRR